MLRRYLAAGFSALALNCIALGAAHADAILWVDDTSGEIGTVDLTTHKVTVVGNSREALTDIAFASNGNLYGVSFSGFFAVSQTTGAATLIDTPDVGFGGLNALVGAPGGGLLTASNTTTSLYSLTTSGIAGTFTGTTGRNSAGDLAFSGSSLYLSAVDPTNGLDELVKLTLAGSSVSAQVIGDFSLSSARFNSVFGLADDGITMYAVDGTEIYTVNLATAALTPDFNYAGHGLGDANGAAIDPTNVPEPGTLVLFAIGLLGLFGLRHKRPA